jgi:hypothetical protein
LESAHESTLAIFTKSSCDLTENIVMTPEPFVSAQEAAKFIGISRRFLTELARRGMAGAYPIGTGEVRKTWVFRLSELAAAIDRKHDTVPPRAAESDQAYHPIIRRSLLK